MCSPHAEWTSRSSASPDSEIAHYQGSGLAQSSKQCWGSPREAAEEAMPTWAVGRSASPPDGQLDNIPAQATVDFSTVGIRVS
jgi:hypothetical protein